MNYAILSVVFTGITALGGLAGFAALRRVRAQNLVDHAQAELTETQVDKLQEELRLSVLESVQVDMARQREETARAQAAEKEALAELAILIAKHERDRADWRHLKHDYEETIRAQSNEIEILRREIEVLREEVRSLRIDRGFEPGRREDDPPST